MTQRFAALVFAVCALTAVAMGTYWYRLEASHAAMRVETTNRLGQASQQLANGVAEQMGAVVRGVDLILQRLRIDYEAGRPSFEQGIRAMYNALPGDAVLQVGVIDTQGFLSYSSAGTQKIYLGDREHFRTHADFPARDKLFISRPVLGLVSKSWSIQFSRPIRRDGRFAGVLVISVSPLYLSRALENLGLGAHDSAALFLADGTYLARNHHVADFLGKQVKASRKFLSDPAVSGSFRDLSSFDDTWRSYSWRRMSDFPLLVVVGLAEPEALAVLEQAIARSREANLLGSGLIVALAGAILLLLWQGERRNKVLQDNEALYRSLFEKNASVKLLIDAASGQIVAANQAACDFYGYPRTVLENLSISEINCLPPEAIKSEMENARNERRAHFFFPHRLANGDIRQVEVYSGPLELDGRQLLYSIIHDVTERAILQRRLHASEMRYRKIFEVVPDGMMLVDPQREIVQWNEAALTILGVDEDGLRKRAVRLLYPDGRPVPAEEYPSARAMNQPAFQGLYQISHDDGSRCWIAVNTRLLSPDEDGETAGAVVSFSDVTRLADLEESLLISQSVFDAAAEGIMVTDADNHIIRVNPAFTRITGYSSDDLLGKTPSTLASGRHDQAFYQAMYQALNDKGRWEGEVVNRRKDGALFVERLMISAVLGPDRKLSRYVALLSDITLKKQQEQDIWHQAHYDHLTELPNRTLFMDRLGQALAQSQRRGLAVGVMFIDLDRFKPVNDRYGHQAGDELLRQTARRIADGLRDEDTVARLGGDEFIVLLPTVANAADGLKVAEKVLDRLQQPFRIGDAIVEISASIGITLSAPDELDGEALVQRADQAMYRAKADGRHVVRQL